MIPAAQKDPAASPDPWHQHFWVDNFLFVFPIAMAIIFAVFAAALAS